MYSCRLDVHSIKPHFFFFVYLSAFVYNNDDVLVCHVSSFLQAFRESMVPGASELLQQLAEGKTDEDEEAIKASVVNIYCGV